MQLVYKYRLYKSSIGYKELLDMCRISKNLYNQALNTILNRYETDRIVLRYNDLNKILQTLKNKEGDINYRLLKVQVSQQILKLLDKNFTSFFKAHKDWTKNPSKYKGEPKRPNYLPEDGFNLLIYTNQSSMIKDGKIYFTKKLSVDIPQYDKYKDKISSFNQIRVIPSSKKKPNYLNIEIIYTVDCVNKSLNKDKYISIDLGVNNIVSIFDTYNRPILLNGRQIKSINRYINKQVGKYSSVTK